MLRYSLPILLVMMGGCQFLPELAHQPTIYNPFPQLSKIAVVPFFNMTSEPTLDGERVAWAYFTELQSVPGFEVVPVATVQEVITRNRLRLGSAEEVRQLAQLLEVDAVVVGAITDYNPYYPPRFGLQVRWYTANPCLHPIPPGYGLPWGTPGEQHIPAPLVFEAEMALAREQMKTQTPGYAPGPNGAAADARPMSTDPEEGGQNQSPVPKGGMQHLNHEQLAAGGQPASASPSASGGVPADGLPPDWPDPRGFVPAPPRVRPAPCHEASNEPVLQHTAVYVGNDPNVTEALESYFYFRNDRRFGGWQGYLQRSEDYIRFCCYMHISEMLTARGGAGETRVVWRWPTDR